MTYPKSVKSKIKYVLGTFGLFCLLFFSVRINIINNYKTYLEIKGSNTEMKYILYINSLYGKENMSLGLGADIFQNCPVSNCYTTSNKSFMPIEKFDAIVFHGPTIGEKFKIPSKRNSFQKYIYFSKESPKMFPVKLYTDHFYNWTMTYRTDSDIYLPYGLIKKQKTNYQLPTIEMVKNKTNLVAWFVSDCWKEPRDDYVVELKNYIPVDVYGKCGHLSCPRSMECYEMLQAKYKFYLSFENSVCKDYVTEKLFTLLNFNIIPVVLGGVNYSKVAPPGSVIDTSSFDSPKSLAKFLLELDANPEEYLKYFEWKKNYIVSDRREEVLCELCAKLHAPITHSSYEMTKWTLGEKSEICKTFKSKRKTKKDVLREYYNKLGQHK